MISEALITLAKEVAARHGLDPALVCAVIEQESGGDTWALRFEPAFYEKYILPLQKQISVTEGTARAFSWGLMQVMGQTAREAGYEGPLAALTDPNTGIEWGCHVLDSKILRAGIFGGLQLWNGGGNPNYATEVLARIPNYR